MRANEGDFALVFWEKACLNNSHNETQAVVQAVVMPVALGAFLRVFLVSTHSPVDHEQTLISFPDSTSRVNGGGTLCFCGFGGGNMCVRATVRVRWMEELIRI